MRQGGRGASSMTSITTPTKIKRRPFPGVPVAPARAPPVATLPGASVHARPVRSESRWASSTARWPTARPTAQLARLIEVHVEEAYMQTGSRLAIAEVMRQVEAEEQKVRLHVLCARGNKC
jgi:hypothetical protein